MADFAAAKKASSRPTESNSVCFVLKKNLERINIAFANWSELGNAHRLRTSFCHTTGHDMLLQDNGFLEGYALCQNPGRLCGMFGEECRPQKEYQVHQIHCSLGRVHGQARW